MIAIPVEFNLNCKLVPSKLFGNAELFALYDLDHTLTTVVKNDKCGNGRDTANFLLEQGVTKSLYSLLGNGPFEVLINAKSEIYHMGENPRTLPEVIEHFKSGSCVQVTLENANDMLDPGTETGSCECGCAS
jgi:predicted Fe-Mo cluster-binding NifX family protein